MIQRNASQNAVCTHFIRTLLDGRRELSEEEALIRKTKLEIDELQLPCAVVCVAPDYTAVECAKKDNAIQECAEYISRFLHRRGFEFWALLNSWDNTQILLHTDNAAILEPTLMELHERLLTRLGLESFIGIGSVVEKYGQIAVSANEASEMLAYKFQYADRGVINIANIVRFQHNISYGNSEMYERVLGCFKDGNIGKMSARLDDLIAEIRYRPNVSGSSIKRTIIELTVNMLNLATNANVDVEEVLQGQDPYHWILQQRDTPTIKAWFMQLASQLAQRMAEQQQRNEKRIIQDACDYVDAHIGDNALGLQSVSESVGLSSSYFSQLFKAEKGVGLNSYIVHRRVEFAMRLLRQTELKNEDIALQLGFARQNYFSSVFKKVTGTTPGRYRKEQLRLDAPQ